ncbi:vacuolar ATPase assembly integral membrane protein VMA21 homolog [Pectinophora gossypiella]|uniref:vacuolar ATPase assembly integral membrane protein VMA21 homolog n=1 Tax=Pectinophora gossypiella TaxID=13191 RepID=UPI00214EAD43|nr:vacuolar ATPase assembly integral membrane protein VMA21 homolog [Pectinophora gossypiella]
MTEVKASEIPDFQVFTTVIRYCLLIISIPVLSFFLAKLVLFDGILKLEPITSSVYSAVVAVLVLHIALALYIYRAYYEAERPPPPKPVKKD